MKKCCKNCNHFKHCVRVYNPYSCCVDYEAKPLTNEEWLRSTTTEELAIWIERIMFIVRYRKEVEDGAYMQTITKKDYIENWLKEIHHDGNA